MVPEGPSQLFPKMLYSVSHSAQVSNTAFAARIKYLSKFKFPFHLFTFHSHDVNIHLCVGHCTTMTHGLVCGPSLMHPQVNHILFKNKDENTFQFSVMNDFGFHF